VRRGRVGRQGCALHLPGQRPKPKPKPKRLWVFCGLGEAVSDCGDAVNPSLGAWPRHPCRGHPAIRHRPAFDSFPVAVGWVLGTAWGMAWGQIRFPLENGSDPRLISISDRDSSTNGVDPQTAEICRRRGGSGCGGVSRMDAATELTWTYLQRPPQPDPPRLPTGNQLLLLLLLQLGAGAGRSPAEHPLSCCAAECIRLNLHALLESI